MQNINMEAAERGDEEDLSVLQDGGSWWIEQIMRNQTLTNKQREAGIRLFEAVKKGSFELVQHLLQDDDTKDNIRPQDKVTALYQACDLYLLKIVKLLIESGVDPNGKDLDGSRPLLRAVKQRRFKTAALLMDNGAEINATDSLGKSILHKVFDLQANDNLQLLKMIKWLIENGANINASDMFENTALFLACGSSRWEAAKLLIRKGADLKARKTGRTVMHVACVDGRLPMVGVLVESGYPSINETDLYGNTPLHLACNRAYLEIARLLIQNGANLSARNNKGRTPLHFAKESAKFVFAGEEDLIEVAKLLITNGSDIEAKDREGITPLRQVCLNGQLDLAKFLVSRGADFCTKNNLGLTPLHQVCQLHHVELAKWLVATGADPNVKNNDGNTPLHWACEYRRWHAAKLLVQNGANVHAKNNEGKTPVHITSWNGLAEMTKLLLDNGANLHVADKGQKTPLHLACEKGHLEVVQLLLIRGANVNATTAEGLTPLNLASNGNHLNVVWLLVRQHPWLVSE